MQFLDEAVIQGYLSQIQYQLADKNQEEVNEIVSTLLELSNILLEKIAQLKSDKLDQKQEFENQLNSQSNELQIFQQIVAQTQRIQSEMVEKESQMYDKIVMLEEELKQQQITNMFYENQKISFHEDNESVEYLNGQLKQKIMENQIISGQLSYQKELSQSYQQKMQEWQQNYNQSLNTIQSLELQLTKMRQELAQQRQQIAIFKEEYINDRNKSALKEIQNTSSNYQQSLQKSQQYSLYKQQISPKIQNSSSDFIIDENYDFCEVKQFTVLENEISASKFKNDRYSAPFRRLGTLLIDSPPKKKIIERNVYKDFFTLLTQCAKLNSQNKFDINTNHLYQEYIDQLIPFHRWYKNIVEYLDKQQ